MCCCFEKDKKNEQAGHFLELLVEQGTNYLVGVMYVLLLVIRGQEK
jgi:hypothetical protein